MELMEQKILFCESRVMMIWDFRGATSRKEVPMEQFILNLLAGLISSAIVAWAFNRLK